MQKGRTLSCTAYAGAEKAGEKEENTGKKKLYYISAEFLIGKLLSNNLINLGIYEEVKKNFPMPVKVLQI